MPSLLLIMPRTFLVSKRIGFSPKTRLAILKRYFDLLIWSLLCFEEKLPYEFGVKYYSSMTNKEFAVHALHIQANQNRILSCLESILGWWLLQKTLFWKQFQIISLFTKENQNQRAIAPLSWNIFLLSRSLALQVILAVIDF